MSDANKDQRKISPLPRAFLAGLIAGIAAGIISYEFVGIIGFIIGFIVGAIVGSRTVLSMARNKENEQ